MFAPERHRQLANLLDVQPTSQVADLGCGRGDTLLEIAPLFDRVVCQNVLECLADPDAFLTEIWRVLVPGGLVVLGHSDFDTIVFTSEDVALTRRLVHCNCDTTQKWMRQSDGTSGRKLVGIAARSLFEVQRVPAWVNVLTSFASGSPGHQAAHAVANIGRRHPAIRQGLSPDTAR